MKDPQLFVEQAAACACQSGALAGYGQVLARRSAHHDVDGAERGDLLVGDVGD
jgi:hypothetical protein